MMCGGDRAPSSQGGVIGQEGGGPHRLGPRPEVMAIWRRTSGQVRALMCALQASTSKPHSAASSSMVAAFRMERSMKFIAPPLCRGGEGWGGSEVSGCGEGGCAWGGRA